MTPCVCIGVCMKPLDSGAWLAADVNRLDVTDGPARLHGQGGNNALRVHDRGVAQVVQAASWKICAPAFHQTASPNLTPFLARSSGVMQPSAPSIAQRAWITSISR